MAEACALHPVRAGRGGVEAAEDIHQRDLPEPDWPIMATKSPFYAQSDVFEHMHVPAAAEIAVDVVTFDWVNMPPSHRRMVQPCRPSCWFRRQRPEIITRFAEADSPGVHIVAEMVMISFSGWLFSPSTRTYYGRRAANGQFAPPALFV